MSRPYTRWIEDFLSSYWALFVAITLAFVWGFWSLPLYDLDEGAFTEATREMLASGNFISIFLDGEPRHDKPILIYWLQAASVTVFGLNEFAFRLPSVMAAILWAVALFRFTREQLDHDTAVVAVLLMALSFYVGLVAKGAVADAVLNLFITLALFDLYRYWKGNDESALWRTYLWLGLGFLTKGPVAILFPILVSGLFFLSGSDLKKWWKAALHLKGWLIFLLIVLPWHIAIYLDSGWAFFEGFYLHHNLDRYSGAMEGHSGEFYYYFLWTFIVFLPFSGWLLQLLIRSRAIDWDELDRFLILWFVTVLLVFSFSSTKLPHYLLYGSPPIFIMLSRNRALVMNRWLAFVPGLLFLLVLAVLPLVFQYLEENTSRLYDRVLFHDGVQAFGPGYQLQVVLLFMAAMFIAFWRGISPWRGVLIIGFIQTAIIAILLLPRLFDVLQAPVKEAALLARASDKEVVRFRLYQPSFSLYRQKVTQSRRPELGEWVLVRVNDLERFHKSLSNFNRVLVYQRGPISLFEMRELDPG